MWTKSLQKKAKSTLPVDERRLKTPMLKLPNIASRDMQVKNTGEMAEGMGKDKRDPTIYIMENVSESTPLNSQFWKALKKVRCWVNMNDVSMYLLWFNFIVGLSKFYFLLFRSHNHTFVYPNTKGHEI